MKPIKRKFAPSLILLIFLSATQLASAFYDPSLGRWLNRDPFGEPGFETLRGNGPSLVGDSANLYLFVFNNPNSWIDLYGLAALDSITASIEACMQLPTPAARLSCLEQLFGDVCFNPRNANAVKNALRGARNQAGKEALKDKSSHQLSSEVSQAAKDWLRKRTDPVTAGWLWRCPPALSMTPLSAAG